MFKIKYGVNKMHCTIISHQVGWFDGKVIHIHLWGLKIKPRNRHLAQVNFQWKNTFLPKKS
jgi:hypothetical protein